jgi:putative endonuclease
MKIISFLFDDMYYIYIIYSLKSDKYYIGLTSDVHRRLSEHNDPSRVNKYTSKHLPWELRLYFEVSGIRGEAQMVERFIKNQKSRIFLEKLIEEKQNTEYFISLINNILEKN